MIYVLLSSESEKMEKKALFGLNMFASWQLRIDPKQFCKSGSELQRHEIAKLNSKLQWNHNEYTVELEENSKTFQMAKNYENSNF